MAQDGKDQQAKPYRVITAAEAALAQFLESITMNWRLKTNLNPKVVGHIRSTSPGPLQFVEFGALDDVGDAAAIGATTKENPEKVELEFSKSQRTARVSLFRLVAKYPGLRVDRGYIRRIPIKLTTANGFSFLELDLKGSTVEKAKVNKKKPEAEEKRPESKGPEDAHKESAAGDENQE